MTETFPKSSTLWHGVILGGLAHAVMTAENSLYGDYRHWLGQDYLAEDQEGLYGTISFEGTLLVATFFDTSSPRNSYNGTGNEYDLLLMFIRSALSY
jgi:hypothetical protein